MAIPSFSSTVVARAAAALYGLQLGNATMNAVYAEANVPNSGGIDALNRLQQEARENLHRTQPVNDPEFLGVVEDVPFPGFEWMPLPQE